MKDDMTNKNQKRTLSILSDTRTLSLVAAFGLALAAMGLSGCAGPADQPGAAAEDKYKERPDNPYSDPYNMPEVLDKPETLR